MTDARRLLTLVVAALALALASGCMESGSFLFSQEDEVSLGRDAADQFESEGKLSTDARLTALVAGIGADLARVASPPNYPYDFRVLGTEEVNAVAFPGGRIYMYSGLAAKLGRDRDMVAWVLGHETAHVALHHTAKRIEKQVGAQMLTEVLLGKGDSARVASLVGDLVLRDYGRKDELRADAQGLMYAQKAGYDPTAAIAVVKVFQSLGSEKDPNRLELLFMTHPGDNTRIDQIKSVCARNGYRGKYYP